ncbi:hypothetical protein NLI96_g11081 [Meripilus lineatus]|uniref:Uncharacterized protein n=1 Tax=Meripilus lineatus TaxID=2056292 RepID=A0AAD5YBC6_9APHY|nr:hypothetical protein NLI96_g11081 [Physisporinus lineatus]
MPSLHRKRTVKIIPVDLDDVMDKWDTDVPCASDIKRSGSDTESIISISSVLSKASSKAKVGPKPSEDHLNDQPMPPMENRPATHAPAALKPSEKAKVGPKPSQDHLNDQPMPPVEN